jgi:acylphosphatase
MKGDTMVASVNKVVASIIFIAVLLLAKGNTTIPLQTDWASLGNPGATIQSSPSVGQNVDGRLEVFLVGSGGVLWHKWQTAPNAGWSSWASLSNPPHVNTLTFPFVGRNADGRLEVFGIGSDGALWHIWQVRAGAGWFSWFSSGQPPVGNTVIPPFVQVNTDGRLEAFTIGKDGALWHIWQTTANGSWSSWASLGKPSSVILNSLVARPNADGRLEVFGIGSDGALWHIWQKTAGGGWWNWFSSGQPSVGNAQPLSPAISSNTDGRLEVFTIGNDGSLQHIWQTTPNGSWSQWASLTKPAAGALISSPTVGRNKDGRLEVLAIGLDRALWHIWQMAAGQGWDGWASLGTPSSITTSPNPFVIGNADGRLEAFTNGSDGALWHIWQVTPGGPWGS